MGDEGSAPSFLEDRCGRSWTTVQTEHLPLSKTSPPSTLNKRIQGSFQSVLLISNMILGVFLSFLTYKMGSIKTFLTLLDIVRFKREVLCKLESALYTQTHMTLGRGERSRKL